MDGKIFFTGLVGAAGLGDGTVTVGSGAGAG